MNNLSWRHHYLPVFYLKGFTKESGLLRIYDVQKNQFVQNGKEFSPESFFFEKHGNTMFHENNQSDFLEKMYSKIENDVSKLLITINSSDNSNKFGINEYDVQCLNLFASVMYWRLPHNKYVLANVLKNNDLLSLGMKVTNKDGSRNIEFENELKNHPEFVKAYRLFNALLDPVRGFHCRTPYNIIQRPEQLPFLCSDNPVIFEKENPNVYENDYVFPLSGKRIFLKTPKQSNFAPFLWLLFDIIIYKQAKKYVSCTDNTYLDMLDETFAKYKMSLEEFKFELFKRLK